MARITNGKRIQNPTSDNFGILKLPALDSHSAYETSIRELTGLKLPKPNQIGNKLWELEIYFENAGSNSSDKCPTKGCLSSHRKGDFITYSLRIDKNVQWFDRLDLALSACSQLQNTNRNATKNGLRYLNIDDPFSSQDPLNDDPFSPSFIK